MNSYFFIPLVLTAVSARDNRGITLKTWTGYKEGDRYFFFPGDDGKNYLIDSLDRRNCPGGLNETSYWLYTRLNPKTKHILKMGDEQSLRTSNFNPHKITVFTVHGWLGDGDTEMNVLLTEASLKNKDVNVIVLDWSTIAKGCYLIARAAVPEVGKLLGRFVKWLHEATGMSLDTVHLIGHSLGGHLIGNAGKELKGRVQRITALDPAGPLWYLDDEHRVAKTDARYVEVIHTSAAGYPMPSGNSDHYPNGGLYMAGCQSWDIVCNHSRSWKYMASTIVFNQIYGSKCKDALEILFNRCSGPHDVMGNSDINKQQSGLYRGDTTAKYPYY